MTESDVTDGSNERQSPPRAVVFDLGGVLVDWNPRYLYRKLLPDDQAVEEFLSTVCTFEWNAQQDAGRSWEDAIAERVAIYPEHEQLIRAYWERWPETLGEVQQEVREIFDLLRREIPVYALTNWSSETWRYAQQRLEFLEQFEGIVVSGFEGMAKPDPRIYQLLIERFSLFPGDSVFIDDMPMNVKAAKDLGFDAIHFLNPKDLREQLQSRSLLSSEA